MQRRILLLLGAASIDFSFQQTITPALPGIQAETQASATELTWLITGFLLAAVVALPLAGPIGDRYGRRRAFLGSLALFAVGAIVCVLADSIGVLIAGRVLQGLGAGVASLALAMVKDHLPPESVPRAIGFLLGAAGVGGVTGLLLTGVLVDEVSIASVFWAQFAVSALVALGVWIMIPESPVRARVPIDWIGGVLVAGGLAALMLAISQSNTWGWGSVRILGLGALSSLLIGTWVTRERSIANPLVGLTLLRRRAIWTANVAGFVASFAHAVPFVLVTLLAGYPTSTGYGLGLSSTEVALVLTPGSAAVLVGGLAGGRLVTWIGARHQAMLGGVFVSASYVAFLALPTTAVALACALVPLGVGIGLSMAAILNLALEGSSTEEAAVTSGLNTVVRTVGQALGPQIAIAVVVAVPALSSGLPAAAGYDNAFVLGLVAAVGSVIAAWVIPAARHDPLVALRVGASTPPVAAGLR